MSNLKFRLATTGSTVNDVGSGIGNAFRALMNAPIAAAQAAEEAKSEQSRRAMQDAQAALFRNKSSEIDDARERATPGSVLRNAAMIHNVAPDQQRDFLSFMESGQLGGQYVTPVDGVGPVLPTPSIYTDGTVQKVARTAGFANQGLAAGDKNIENLAKVEKLYRDMGLGDDVLAGRRDAGSVGQSQAAMEGKKVFDNIGTTGMGYNQFTGQGKQLDEGLRIIFGDQAAAEIKARDAQAGASRASAASSYASAENSRASAAKTRQEREQGASSGQTQIVTDANGNVTLVNKATGLARPATYADGKTVGAKVGSGSSGTEGERNASGYADRMTAAERLIQKVAKQSPGAQKPTFTEQATGGVGMIANFSRDEERQQYRQAQEDWVRAKLRKESGAAIPSDEMEREISVYFPQINDGPKVIGQKADARKVAEGAMRQAAGRAQSSLPPQADGGGPPQIKSDADYAALPSGAEFVAPDGSRRRKP